MTKAWAFYRRSTDTQQLSISDQRAECQALAVRNGWQIVREFEPLKGWGSGLTIDQDPCFQKMIQLAEHGGHGVSYLIVYDVSRFGRLQPEEKIYWEQRLKKQGGVKTIYCKDEFLNDGSISDTLLKVVKHSEAHQFSVKLSQLTLRGAKSHTALGHSAGGSAPYGYDRLLIDAGGEPVKILRRGEHKADKLQRVVWKPSQTEAPVVREIFQSYDGGKGLHKIVDDMNTRKIPAPRGEFWTKSLVHYLLRNRAYLGERIYNRRSYRGYRRGERGSLFNPRAQWVTKTDAHEPIVDEALFNRVQSKFAARYAVFRTSGNPYQKKPYLLSGLAFCSRCGYRMIGYPKAGNGHRYLTYTCSGYHRIGKSVCRSVHVLTDSLEETVVQSIRDHLAEPEWKAEVYATLKDMIQEEFGEGAENRLKELQDQLKAVNRQIANIVEAIKTSGRFSEAINQELVNLEGQRESIRKDLGEAEKRINQRTGAETLADKIMGSYGQFDRLWKRCATLEEQKEAIRCYVHHVNVDHSPDHVKANIALYKVPIPQKIETPALNGLEPLIARVYCGGRI